jgi:hypothetical protein
MLPMLDLAITAGLDTGGSGGRSSVIEVVGPRYSAFIARVRVDFAQDLLDFGFG